MTDSLPDRRLHVRGHAMGIILVLAAATVAGCGSVSPKLPVSDQHIVAPKTAAAPDDILPPVTAPSLPAPRAQQKQATYSVVVNEVPLKELLLALARDTKQNIDIHPALSGLVSLNAIDETLPAILDRISKQVNLRWKQDGRTITVTPDTPYVKTYRVNYVNVSRETDSVIAVSGQIGNVSGTGAAGGTGGGAGTGAAGNASTATVTSKSRNDFWETLEKNIKAVLSATRTQALSADERAARDESQRAQREERIAQAEAVARAGANAKDLFTSAFDSQAKPPLPGDVTNEVAVNAVAGTVTVLATDTQHRLVQEYLDAVMAASQRQVLIEATIVEVTLSQQYQSGVDWGRVAGTPGSGIEFKQQMLTSSRLPVSSLAPVAALTFGAASQSGVFGAIRLLEQFGNTRVLSSPKVMAINNQTALLKVVRNLVYFQVQQQQSQAANTGTLNSITTIARTVPVGLVMSLTPQINETGNVTLTVRPTVTSQVGSVLDPNPLLSIENSVPVVEVREIESVLQLASGQTAILGGLIKDEVQRDRDQIPGLGRTRIGDAFAYRNEVAKKTELVIFLRPTVIRSPSLDSDELKFLRTQLPKPEQLTAPFEMPPAR